MAWLIIGILGLAIPVSIAAFIRALRLAGGIKKVLVTLSLLSILSNVVAFFSIFDEKVPHNIVLILFFSSLGFSLLTLALSIHFLAKFHNRLFTDKTKEHKEGVKRALDAQKGKEE